MSETAPDTPRPTIPRSALVLGWLGVLPFVGLALLILFGRDLGVAWTPSTAMIAYGACILSFMGGVQWGVTLLTRRGGAIVAGSGSEAWGYGISVIPALIAWPCLLLPARDGLIGLILGFALLLIYDARTVRDGLAPPWYTALRAQLTGAVVICLALSATRV